MVNFALIGDVHSIYERLYNAIEYCKNNSLTPILLGDLFDSRCSISESVKVYELVRNSENDLNAIVLHSNHQDKYLRYLKGNKVILNHGLELTVKEFENSNIQKQEIIDWLDSRPYGVVFKDKNGSEYRCAHAYFSSKIEVPEYQDYYLVDSKCLNRKIKNVMIYGPTNENGRVEWWNSPRRHDYIMVSGHYHKVVIEDHCLIIDGECGDEKPESFLPLYDVNKKLLKKF